MNETRKWLKETARKPEILAIKKQLEKAPPTELSGAAKSEAYALAIRQAARKAKVQIELKRGCLYLKGKVRIEREQFHYLFALIARKWPLGQVETSRLSGDTFLKVVCN